MNIFIAQKMTGLTDEQIESTRNKIIELCKEKYGNDAIILDQFHLPDDVPKDVYDKHSEGIYLLGRSLQILAKADIVVFAPDYNNSKGSLIEEKVCEIYEIPHEYVNF